MDMHTRNKWYVGLNDGKRELFRSAVTPVQDGRYLAVWGPFQTKRGALFGLRHGANNPHVQSVSDAERIARQHT